MLRHRLTKDAGGKRQHECHDGGMHCALLRTHAAETKARVKGFGVRLSRLNHGHILRR
jgi:hypothetical protein